MLKTSQTPLAAALLIAGLAVGYGAPASAQTMGSAAWNFTGQNRAAIANLIEQQRRYSEDGVSGSSTALAPANSSACGGGGTAAATGNYTCIIITESNAAIEALQDTIGDQQADSNTNTSVTTGDVVSDIDDVLDTLTN